MSGYSVKDVESFLDYCGQKGLLKSNTATSRKTAVSKILGQLDADEQTDVRNVDLKAAFNRWQNMSGRDYDPSSLAVYESRMRSGVNDFLRWREDPKSFKPSGNTRKAATGEGKRRKAPAPTSLGAEQDQLGSTERDASEPSNAPALVFSVPVRPGVAAWVRITGLPRDLTLSEAKHAATLTKAMVEPLLLATAHAPES